jgi:Carboxypeptidase regulatory-like domain
MTIEKSNSRPPANRPTAPRVVFAFEISPRVHKRSRDRWNRILSVPACAFVLWLVVPAIAFAQQHTTLVSTAVDALPDAPQPQTEMQQGAEQSKPIEGDASIAGIVQDTTGALIVGAQVSLTQRDGRNLLTVLSGANGEFAFTKLPAGSYSVLVNAKGFTSFASEAITLAPFQSFIIPNITLNVGANFTEVTVRPTEVIAAEQIKQEEKQRLLGIVANFYVSYEHDAAPMTSKQKLSLAMHDTFDWTSFIGISAAAGIEQANNTYKGYGQGAAGYGKRWGALFADGRSSDFLDHYVFASLFHQDPRYFYQGTGTKKSRLFHAISSAFVSRSDSGTTMPNYSYLLGTMCAGALSNAYYPSADRGASLVFVNAAIGIAGRAGGAVLQEFLGKRFTKNAPKATPSD